MISNVAMLVKTSFENMYLGKFAAAVERKYEFLFIDLFIWEDTERT